MFIRGAKNDKSLLVEKCQKFHKAVHAWMCQWRSAFLNAEFILKFTADSGGEGISKIYWNLAITVGV